MIEFKLEDNEYIQLCDLLKRVGVSQSGGEAKVMISEGVVQVDGKVETRKRAKIKIGSLIQVEDESIKVV